MERTGERLKRVRERLRLTYRDVERASQRIAEGRNSDEFSIALSRLADIENKGTIPSIFRLYSLCAIYRLEFNEVLRWYGVPVEDLASQSLQLGIDSTHELNFKPGPVVTVPQPLEAQVDWEKTTFLSEAVRRFGKMPLTFLQGLDVNEYRYGLIGQQDWSMYPILHPGTLVAIDQKRRKILSGGWSNELDRPIYFLELRDGYRCGWCSLRENQLILQPHPGSQQAAEVFEFPRDIEVIGQVIGVAMLLESRKHRPVRNAITPTESPDR